MKRYAKHGLAALGLLFLATLAGAFSGVRAIAQTAIRAVLVKNIDEPGRSPYQGYVGFSSISTNNDYFCTPNGLSCSLYFPPVPAGKRLVVESLTGTVNTPAPGFPLELIVFSEPTFQRIGIIPFRLLAGVTGNQQYTYGIDSNARGYVDGGGRVTLTINIFGTASAPVVQGQFSVVGYLVDLTQ